MRRLIKGVQSAAFMLFVATAGLAVLYGVLVVMTWVFVAAWFFLSKQYQPPPPPAPIQVVQPAPETTVAPQPTEPIKQPGGSTGDTSQ